MKKVLITGSRGFIGRNLKEQLKRDYDVYAPSRAELDLLNQGQTENYLAQHRFHIVIHAANTNDFLHKKSDYEILSCNLKMFYHLERCSHLFDRMLYFGSGAEYDKRHYIPRMREEYFGKSIPEDPYGLSKYSMAKSIKEDGNIYELILFGVYGKYEEWQRRFISNAICRKLLNMPITISKNVYFDYLYIEDLIRIVIWFMENDPKYRHYNVCTGGKYDLYSLGKLIDELTPEKGKGILVKEAGWKPEYTGDNQRLLMEMKKLCFSDIRITIAEMYHYYQDILDTIVADELV